ncbi:hypothetical protein [Streptomyces sp. NBC_00239]|uniref:hypothetical protein n=1 Tax=Streptomyces sp. NBC_00239 TaxID=2903640 RepID=UPI002E288A85|nr:hypothetical protein [Streptomyces sp. NBC_00239]
MRPARVPERHEVFECKLCPCKGTNREIRGVGARMAAYHVCSSGDFWLTCLGYVMLGDHDPDGRRVLRIDGRHYLTWTEEQGFPPEIGYAGVERRHYVLLDDPHGTVHATHRVWLMGTIPGAFRDRMPDNAAFAPAP